VFKIEQTEVLGSRLESPPEFMQLIGPSASSQRGDGKVMKDHTEEWKNLCEQAAVEQDPEKLLELIQRINNLLDDKKKRRTGAPKNDQKS
jgi:hypothetical protein